LAAVVGGAGAKVAIYKARQRLGREPLELLFRAVAVPLASASTRGAFYGQWRLVSLDGTCLDVADTDADTEAFGAAWFLAQGGWRRVPAAAAGGVGGVRHARDLRRCARPLYEALSRSSPSGCGGSLTDGMLCLADRSFYSFERFPNRPCDGAQLLWRVKADVGLPREQALPDGSYLTSIYALKNRKAKPRRASPPG